MRTFQWLVWATVSVALGASIPPGDARRGEQIFLNERCIDCHAVNGKGGSIAPDLGKRVDRDFSPALLAATMWNHAPAMWAAMRKQGIVKSTLSTESAADLFAYFYSARFFDRPGDGGRGKALFASKRCAECHGITSSNYAGAPPVARWDALGHPIALIGEMWNHASAMRDAFAKKGIAWPELTSQELADILVYLRNAPETRSQAASTGYTLAEGGEAVFNAKCAGCHKGQLALETRLHNLTVTDIAVRMWNHAPKMSATTPALTDQEMRGLLGYLWSRQFFLTSGDPERGKRVFTRKNCATCHSGSGGAPNLAEHRPFTDISMVSALWEHGPRMLERMREKNLPWPRFERGQMSDLIAYLNSLQ